MATWAPGLDSESVELDGVLDLALGPRLGVVRRLDRSWIEVELSNPGLVSRVTVSDLVALPTASQFVVGVVEGVTRRGDAETAGPARGAGVAAAAPAPSRAGVAGTGRAVGRTGAPAAAHAPAKKGAASDPPVAIRIMPIGAFNAGETGAPERLPAARLHIRTSAATAI